MEYQVLSCGNLQYILRYPKNFSQEQQWPVLLYLHGSGTRGKAPEAVLETDSFSFTAKHENFPFLMIAPLCPPGSTWFQWMPDLKALIEEISALPYADTDRFYGMGASMGGYGIWELAMSQPETFAAILPICGGGMYWNAKRLVNVPVWAFHGAKDKTVSCEESQKMVDAVNKHGGNAKLTIYPDNSHNAWSDTYANPLVFTWLLEHTNKNEQDTADVYTDAAKFG